MPFACFNNSFLRLYRKVHNAIQSLILMRHFYPTQGAAVAAGVLHNSCNLIMMLRSITSNLCKGRHCFLNKLYLSTVFLGGYRDKLEQKIKVQYCI